MEQGKYLFEYNQIKSKMELSVRKFRLTDRSTIDLSKKFDLLVIEIMRIKYLIFNKLARIV
ncbi:MULTISPECIES: hypothetical protein [Bacillaceae]|uniref:hypothetical protein n=1 Tax=Bacillaceae TaxID=186817 RepID=UPI000BFE68EE|nr:hypothetical protein [Bacillus sp. AFS031507]PGY13035.1 hypothetical protein COE25_07610 [Bacillus sp. AFS031507]